MQNRRIFLNRLSQGAAVIGASTWLSQSWAAEDAISSTHITFGSSMALSGPLASAATEHMIAIQAAFAQINKAGGIHGRELRFACKDDGYVPARTAENVKQMIDDNSVFSLMSVMGAPHTASILPLVEKVGVPLLGPLTGTTSLRQSQHRFVFHLRPSYTDEVTRMVQQLVQMGLQDIAVVYLDNPFGKEVLATVQRVLTENKLKAMVAVPLAVDGKNAVNAAQQVLDSKAGVVFLGTTGTGTSDLVLAVREKAAGLPMIGLSVAFTDFSRLGHQIAGIAVASVFPSGKATKFAVVRNYQASLEASNLKNPNGIGLESWITAQVMAESVRRAGRDITREKLRVALASIRGFAMGEVTINFPVVGPYVGTNSVKLGIFGADGIPRS